MKAKLAVLTFKIENAYAIDAAPTASADVLLAQNVNINPLEMDTDEYMPVSNKFGAFEKIVGATWCTVDFDVLNAGGGTPVGVVGSIPNCDAVLRAAAMARIITAGTTIGYSPIDTAEESATMYYYVDGVLQKMVGLRGDLSWTLSEKRAPVMKFRGIGLNEPMTDLTLPTPTLPTPPRPLAVNKANTITAIDETFYGRISALQINLGNDVQYRNLTNREDVVVVDRNMSGSITIEMPKVAEKNFLGANGIVTKATPVSLYPVHGTTPGNILRWDLPAVQLFKPKPTVVSGILMLQCEIHVVRNNFGFQFQ